jgi:G3E family GTPase
LISRTPIPVSILTGFLGAGKTTLLNRLLKDPALTDTAVIINEIGDIAIDHLLVETASDGVIELAGGCLCCTVRGELVDTLADLVDRLQTGRIASLKRVVVETTGLADPVPVLQALMAHPALLQAFRMDGVITAVDAVNGAATLDNHIEAVRQVAVADRIVLTKTELTSDDATTALVERLRGINHGAPVLDAAKGESEATALLNCGLFDPTTKSANVAAWLRHEAAGAGEHARHNHEHEHEHGHAHHHHEHGPHDARVRSFSLQHGNAVPYAAIEAFLDLLRSAHGDRLLRMKGIIELADDPAHPLVIHGVQRLIHPPVRLPAWPEGPRGVRLVLIAMDLPEEVVRRLFSAFTGQPGIGLPDRAALTDNPLVVAGAFAR